MTGDPNSARWNHIADCTQIDAPTISIDRAESIAYEVTPLPAARNSFGMGCRDSID
jgi:hypothetical protein